MTDDLDTLRPEVREAVREITFTAASSRPDLQRYIATIRAELLRLAAMERAWKQWIKDGMRVEFMPQEPPK